MPKGRQGMDKRNTVMTKRSIALKGFAAGTKRSGDDATKETHEMKMFGIQQT